MDARQKTIAPKKPKPPCQPLVARDWTVWWKMLRPHTLTASFVPVAVGTALSLPAAQFRPSLFLAMLAASIFIQAATNMFNEYYDYRSGLDDTQSVGIGGTIVRHGVAPRTVLAIALALFGAAFLLGLYLCSQTSWWLLPVGLACAAVGYLYSGGPYPISATPFGELAAGAAMGLGIISISFFIQTGAVTAASILVSVPTSVLIGAILMANNIRDRDKDREHGRQTLAIRLGKNRAIACLAGMFALAYAWVPFLIAAGVVGPWTLLSVLSLPKPIQAIKGFRRHTSPEAMMPAMVATAQTNTLFGLGLALGLFIEYWL